MNDAHKQNKKHARYRRALRKINELAESDLKLKEQVKSGEITSQQAVTLRSKIRSEIQHFKGLSACKPMSYD